MDTGAGSRFIDVTIAAGVVAKVRVLSQHPEDDAARRNLYRASALWDWADKQIERATAEADRGKAEALLEQMVEAKMVRDKSRREAISAALTQHQTGEQIEGVYRQCDDQTFLLLFNAAQGIDPTEMVADRLRRLVAQLKLTPAEVLGVCFPLEQLESLFTAPTASTPPTVT